MNFEQDTEFLASLRGLVDDVAPKSAPLSAATVIPAARRRITRRRSFATGAFGVALLAGAGATQALPLLPQNPAPVVVMSADAGVAGGDSEHAGLVRGLEIAPLATDIEATSDDIAIKTAEGVAPTGSQFDPANPWTSSLLAAGVSALGVATAITARAPKAAKK